MMVESVSTDIDKMFSAFDFKSSTLKMKDVIGKNIYIHSYTGTHSSQYGDGVKMELSFNDGIHRTITTTGKVLREQLEMVKAFPVHCKVITKKSEKGYNYYMLTEPDKEEFR